MVTEIVEQENRRLRCPYLVRVKTVEQPSSFNKFTTLGFGLSLIIFDIIWLNSIIMSIFKFPTSGCELFLVVFIFILCPIGVSIFALSVCYTEMVNGEEK